MDCLFEFGLCTVLVKIFISLSPQELHTARQVCRRWNSLIIDEIWNRKRTRRILEERLGKNWNSGNYLRYSKSMSDYVSDLYNYGVKIIDQYIILHPKVYDFSIKANSIILIDVKTGNKIKERETNFEKFVYSVDSGHNFLVFSLGNLPKDEEERLEVISIPDLRTIDIVQLNENSRMFAVASSSILFLSPYKQSLDLSEFIEYDPRTKQRSKFRIRFSYYDALHIWFDGRFAVIKKLKEDLDEEDRTIVYNIQSRKLIISDVCCGMFKLNELFRYPLLVSIQDHAELRLFNLETMGECTRFIHQADPATARGSQRVEFGLGNQMLLSSDQLLMTRYNKYAGDHSDCSAHLDVYRIADLQAGKLSPSFIKLQEGGQLFDGISVSKTGFVLLNNKTRTVDVFRFWT